MVSHIDLASLEKWCDTFAKEVLNNGTSNTPWYFTLQGVSGPDPWVIFHMLRERTAVTSRYTKCYHGCPLSVAKDILQNGFIIGKSEAVWFCTHGLFGFGRFHAQDRSRGEKIGWTENGQPCLWTQAVAISFTLPDSSFSSGRHEPVGKDTIALSDVMRLNKLPAASRCLRKGDILQLRLPPFGSGSVELHMNLRYYFNYQQWDMYLLKNGLTGGLLKLDIIEQLSTGEAFLCCCKEREPFSYSATTCGALTFKTNALRDGWERSKNNSYWYCRVCKEFRLSNRSYQSLTRDSL